MSDGRITLGDKARWKKHFRSFKRQAYAMGFGSQSYRANYDSIRWPAAGNGDEVAGRRRGDCGSSVVYPDIGDERCW